MATWRPGCRVDALGSTLLPALYLTLSSRELYSLCRFSGSTSCEGVADGDQVAVLGDCLHEPEMRSTARSVSLALLRTLKSPSLLGGFSLAESGERKLSGFGASVPRGWHVSGVFWVGSWSRVARRMRFLCLAFCAGFGNLPPRVVSRTAACCWAWSSGDLILNVYEFGNGCSRANVDDPSLFGFESSIVVSFSRYWVPL
jgi:hypothetical protein